MQRRGGGRDAVDIEGGDKPVFGDNFDDDKKDRKSGGMMDMLGGGLGMGADIGRVFQPSGDSGPNDKFFIDLRDKLLVAGGVGFAFY